MSRLCGFLIGAGVLGFSLCGWAEQNQSEPGRKRLNGPDAVTTQIVRNAARLLPEHHLSKHPLDAEIAHRWLKLFLRDLDLNKLFFQKEDVESFERQLAGLPERFGQGDVRLAYDMFEKFLERLDGGLKLALDILEKNPELEGDDEYRFDPAQTTYADSNLKAQEIWRKRVMYNLLLHRADKADAQEAKARVQRQLQAFRQRYLEVDDAELVEMAVGALARAFDAKSTYIAARSWRQFQDDLRGQLEGIGMQFALRDNVPEVLRIFPGSPAHQDGRLKVGDKIVGVDTEGKGKIVDVIGKRTTDIARLIRGKRGTKVRLEVIPAGQSERVLITLTRAPILTATAYGQVLDAGPKPGGGTLRVGYVFLPSLYGSTSGAKGNACSEDVRRILQEGERSFRASAADLVVLDLRTNSGGLLREALEVTELFIPQGPLYQVKGAGGEIHAISGEKKAAAWEGPMVVLTSRSSSSGTELIVGALQSYARALVVGESTNGVGTVQNLFGVLGTKDLKDPKLGVLRITGQQFYRPNGESTQKRGVTPDVELPWLANPPAGEAAQDYATEFDRVDTLRFDRFRLGIDDKLRTALRGKSAERRKASPEFQKLADMSAAFSQIKTRGTVPLNLKRYLDERSRTSLLPSDDVRFRKVEEASEVNRDFYLEEVLAICRDYWGMWEK